MAPLGEALGQRAGVHDGPDGVGRAAEQADPHRAGW
jgi:hypothetical protein